ncbi:hypothetical protein SmJEL517_g02136 [Synchytrium microbalum]|uniref:DNA 3'-5' helicase n=1 Tax=Synchytrium microbalum TaxID=1806994 RepID=A0A507CD90_9FUNG|nr:uncharacterized protein SmJEL517_g02136 [Synchytrium microbalum]TPX35525.1 hypothetical protein SmJEL517_g02136 [Synchytrium microbalum]
MYRNQSRQGRWQNTASSGPPALSSHAAPNQHYWSGDDGGDLRFQAHFARTSSRRPSMTQLPSLPMMSERPWMQQQAGTWQLPCSGSFGENDGDGPATRTQGQPIRDSYHESDMFQNEDHLLTFDDNDASQSYNGHRSPQFNSQPSYNTQPLPLPPARFQPSVRSQPSQKYPSSAQNLQMPPTQRRPTQQQNPNRLYNQPTQTYQQRASSNNYNDLQPSSQASQAPRQPVARNNTLNRPSFPQQQPQQQQQQYQQQSYPTAPSQPLLRNHAPVVQGTVLKAVSELGERFRSLFAFPYFNSVQSQCFDIAMNTDCNLVVSAPTGSGKTVLMELAMIRLFMRPDGDQAKVVYMAPTKALCNERTVDWQKKFRNLGIKCNELTGDTDYVSVAEIRRSNIIVTTPEKWDSISRRWRDQKALMGLLRLFLIDEVHLLNESKRGATLEVVVSRMRTLGLEVERQKSTNLDSTQHQQIRLLALSATVPNIDDIADWLKNSDGTRAEIKTFGEEYRPVKLQKEVIGYPPKGNPFVFEQSLDYKLMDAISKYSQSKATMIFCSTRKSAQFSADTIAKACSTVVTGGFGDVHPFVKTKNQYENLRHLRTGLKDKKLGDVVISGVAFHHAGMASEDRQKIEQGFLAGNVIVICTTSTLAVGINLPAYLVIIKGTQQYTSTGYQEYQGLDIMQMMGRAGRPQFEDSGVALIMTDSEQKNKYLQMVAGTEIIESSLHENLIEHLNAEIVLGTVTNVGLAIEWLKSSFLYVRIKKNPAHYKLKNTTTVIAKLSAEKRLEGIYTTDMDLLRKKHLIAVSDDGHGLQPTEFGKIMAKYCLKFNTTVAILQVSKAALKDVLTCLSKAEEFAEIRFRGDKGELNAISKQTRFPIKGGKVKDVCDKVTILLQAVFGSISLENQKASTEFSMQTNAIFNAAPTVGRAMIEIFMEKGDEISVRSSITLYQCINAKSWESADGLVLKQIDGIGPQSARILAAKGISTMPRILRADARELELALNRNPPFGNKLLDAAKTLPQFTMVINQNKENPRTRQADLQVKLALANKDTCKTSGRSPPSAIFLVTSSDHQLIEHRRVMISKLKDSISFSLSLNANQPSMHIMCSLLSEDYVGIDVHSQLVLEIKGPFLPNRKELPKPPVKKHLDLTPIEPVDPDEDDYDLPFDEAELLLVDEVLKANGLEPMDEPPHSDQDHADMMETGLGSDTQFEETVQAMMVDDKQVQQTAPPRPKPEDIKNRLLQDGAAAGLAPGLVPCDHKCGEKNSCKHLCCKTGIPVKKALKRKIKPSVERDPSSSQAEFSSEGEDSAIVKKPKHAEPKRKAFSRLGNFDDDDSDFESDVEQHVRPTEKLSKVASKRIVRDSPTNDDSSIDVIDLDTTTPENGLVLSLPWAERDNLNNLHKMTSATARVSSLRLALTSTDVPSPITSPGTTMSSVSRPPLSVFSAMSKVQPQARNATLTNQRIKATLDNLNSLHDKTVTNRVGKSSLKSSSDRNVDGQNDRVDIQEEGDVSQMQTVPDIAPKEAEFKAACNSFLDFLNNLQVDENGHMHMKKDDKPQRDDDAEFSKSLEDIDSLFM